MSAHAPSPTPAPERLFFECERCGSNDRMTHILEISEGEIVSFTRLCGTCLKHEFTERTERRRR